MSLNPNSKHSEPGAWPTLDQAKEKNDIPGLGERFEKIEAPVDRSKEPEAKEDEGYLVIDKKSIPHPGELERNGKPYGTVGSVAIEKKGFLGLFGKKTAKADEPDKMVDDFVELPGDLEVDAKGEPVKKSKKV